MNEQVVDLDIRKGDFITVIQWFNIPDRSWIGDYLKVMAVDWPFVKVVEFIWKDGLLVPLFGDAFNLDLREVQIRKFSADMLEGGQP